MNGEAFTYTKCYCEENVYLLCQSLAQRGLADAAMRDLYVVFISNLNRTVAVHRQRSGHGDHGRVIWDYHVICLRIPLEHAPQNMASLDRPGCAALVWDLDTTLPLPVDALEYLGKCFLAPAFERPAYRPLFRIVPAPLFRKVFSSDRSHMIRADGSWSSPPPSYPCIQAPGSTFPAHNLDGFIDMHAVPGGTTLEDLLAGDKDKSDSTALRADESPEPRGIMSGHLLEVDDSSGTKDLGDFGDGPLTGMDRDRGMLGQPEGMPGNGRESYGVVVDIGQLTEFLVASVRQYKVSAQLALV
eukprot:jgi/Mesvir1/13162/Mv06127-RA.1